MHDWATVDGGLIHGLRYGKHIAKYGGLLGQDVAVDAELGGLRLEDDVATGHPDLGAADGSCRLGVGICSLPFGRGRDVCVRH